MVVGVRVFQVRLLHCLQSNLGDCDGEGLRGHAYVYETRPIAVMSYNNGDGFCLAVSGPNLL